MIELIKSRRNIKKFRSEQVDETVIKNWLNAAAMAPNHRMTEPWEIIFIGSETREKLNHKSNFGNAPTLFAVLSRHGATKVESEENVAATACFIQNFNLAAWSEGVGTFWSSIGITGQNRDLLKVPEHFDLLGVLAVGYPEMIPDPKPRTPIENKLTYLP